MRKQRFHSVPLSVWGPCSPRKAGITEDQLTGGDAVQGSDTTLEQGQSVRE